MDLFLLVEPAIVAAIGGLSMVWLAASTRGRDTSIESVSDFLLKTNIVVCEFAHLSVVDTENLSLLRCAKAETGDEVHDPQDDRLLGRRQLIS